ncbi:MAG: hypothetical protein SGI92_12690 [Bryobacteraceae bacterium]|nr:hypothetical protein [Bryobacteraceae bacterium]
MHTRRFGAFIAGMWLMGTILMWFAVTQTNMTVERLFSNPPVQIQKEINDMGPDVARQVFRYQASLFIRRVSETWEVIQLGILGALLATSILTAHRSRMVLVSTILMLIFVLFQAFYFTPLMTGLARSYDFLPATAALREREAYAGFLNWYRVLNVLKTLLALLIVSRLLFDFYDFGSVVFPWSRAPKKRRRIRRSSLRPGVTATPMGPAGPEEIDPHATPAPAPAPGDRERD